MCTSLIFILYYANQYLAMLKNNVVNFDLLFQEQLIYWFYEINLFFEWY